MRPFRGINRFGWGDAPPQARELIGFWRACGLCEGLDMRTADGRACYYPVGRGGVRFEADGRFRLTAVNGAGVFERTGSWALEGSVLHVRLGEDEGRYRLRLEGGALALAPDRTFLRCADKLLHGPVFEKEEEDKER